MTTARVRGETVDEKADRLLVSGAVRVVHASAAGAAVLVSGDTGLHRVEVSAAGWSCSCPATVRRCSHRLAAELVVDPRWAP